MSLPGGRSPRPAARPKIWRRQPVSIPARPRRQACRSSGLVAISPLTRRQRPDASSRKRRVLAAPGDGPTAQIDRLCATHRGGLAGLIAVQNGG
jgi:hypothetical protein